MHMSNNVDDEESYYSFGLGYKINQFIYLLLANYNYLLVFIKFLSFNYFVKSNFILLIEEKYYKIKVLFNLLNKTIYFSIFFCFIDEYVFFFVDFKWQIYILTSEIY